MPSNNPQNRVVILCGPRLPHLNTCATLIRSGLNVVGICMADQRTAGLPFKYLLKSAQRKGVWPTISRSLARLAYMALNSSQDRAAFEKIFHRGKIEAALHPWRDRIHHTDNYSSPQTLAWLKEQKADVFVVHTPYWVGKKVRDLPVKGIVLGGHPGITPAYRGSHSAFWAVYSRKPEDVGCTVFLIDSGVDTGDVVAQERIPVEKGDSFITLSWKAMVRIAELQVQALKKFDEGQEMPRRKVVVPAGSEFDNPTLGEFLRYRMRQQLVR
ncbi:MAG TPA: formyltransferase family protein [Candidatus Acidoferrales bacterium]|nr:formyltransferase family protein [Candidatus Acidoferrales bacterium]